MPEDVQLRKLVLLPGMDGTGELFVPFIEALPVSFETVVARFPADSCLSYPRLAEIVQALLPVSEPFVLVAESFSTPLALQCAAAKPPNLKALVICAGFATSPLRGWRRSMLRRLAPLLFRISLPTSLTKELLAGSGASPSLISRVKNAVSSVQSNVLSDRLRLIFNCDARAELARIDTPILYLLATRDKLVPAWCAEQMHKIKPEMVIVPIDGPHLLLQREPRQTADAVADFVRGLV
jgi:pimeloyl-ACP methyl ester carboxylesterase